MFHSARVPSLLVTGRPSEPGIQAAWKPNRARGVAHMRLRGMMPSTSVQADRQLPSMTTRSPEERSVAKVCR